MGFDSFARPAASRSSSGLLAILLCFLVACSCQETKGTLVSSCEAGLEACGEGCVDWGSDPLHCGGCDRACPLEETCVEGRCLPRCPPGRDSCLGACVSLDSNPLHCGVCELKCPGEEFCSAGRCVPTCAPGETACGRSCVDLDADDAHCGSCDVACEAAPGVAGNRCVQGACVLTCEAGFEDCDGDPANGCEVDLRADAKNCWLCGNACPAGQICDAGTCGCPAGQGWCGGRCIGIVEDPRNCGGCGVVCDSGAMQVASACVDGQCQATCVDGWGDCDGTPGCETQLGSDKENCGACGQPCAGAEQCVDGGCLCPTGASVCSGVCADVSTDPAHCGGCGNDCAAAPNVHAAICLAGGCVPSCQVGFGDCTAAPGCETRLSDDPSHCGSCDKSCRGDQICVAGFCACPPGQMECGGICTDISNDDTNCGGCGLRCAGQPNALAGRCEAGACVHTCAPGFEDCDPKRAGCETNTGADPLHCGGCGEPCAVPGMSCAAGSCSCGEETACPGGCADLESDPDNCGACGNKCTLAGSQCVDGQCGCGEGIVCPSGCVDLSSDPANCGACGEACTLPGSVCVEGACGCGALDECPTGCVDLQSDRLHCGACGVACGTGMACTEGICTATRLAPRLGLHTCLLTPGKKVYCWGSNEKSQTGSDRLVGTKITSPRLVEGLPAGTTATAVALSADDTSASSSYGLFSCALLSNQRVACWGAKRNGQLGDGTHDASGSTPVAQIVERATGGTLENAVQVAVGGRSACALLEGADAGRVMCWGNTTGGVLGNGVSVTQYSKAVFVQDGAGAVLGGVVGIAAGYEHHCALRGSGEVLCWGVNGRGQLGDGSTTGRSRATPVAGMAGLVATQISAGGYASCAVLGAGRAGEALCWGYNSNGQMGNGSSSSTNHQKTPAPVLNLADAVEVSVGYQHVCALRSNGRASCWGHNFNYSLGNGQGGNGAWSQSNVPVEVLVQAGGQALQPIVQIAAGSNHTCAVLESGEVKCWGYGVLGATGIGSTPQFVQVPTTVTLP